MMPADYTRQQAINEAGEFIVALVELANDKTISPRTRVAAISAAREWVRERNKLLGLHRQRLLIPTLDYLLQEIPASCDEVNDACQVS